MVTVFEHFSAGKNLYNAMTAPVCREYGLTQMEFNILLFLANNPQYTTAAQIVKYRNLTKSHVSISVKTLQEKGLLTGENQSGDRRVTQLRLTEKAMPIVRTGRQAQEKFGRRLVEGFTVEEVKQLEQFLTRIHNNMVAGE